MIKNNNKNNVPNYVLYEEAKVYTGKINKFSITTRTPKY